MGATEIVQALVSPAEKLIEAVSGAIGKAYEPKQRLYLRAFGMIFEYMCLYAYCR